MARSLAKIAHNLDTSKTWEYDCYAAFRMKYKSQEMQPPKEGRDRSYNPDLKIKIPIISLLNEEENLKVEVKVKRVFLSLDEFLAHSITN